MEEAEEDAFAAESIAKKMVEVNEWRGSDYVNSEGFNGIIAPMLEIPGSKSPDSRNLMSVRMRLLTYVTRQSDNT